MKVTPLDFLLSMLAMILLGGLSYLLTALAAPYVLAAVGDYHVVADVAIMLLAYGILSGILIRVLLAVRPFQLGEFDMDHPSFTYWKLLAMLFEFGTYALKPFTTIPLKPVIAKLYGGRIGKNVALGGVIEEPYLVTIGDGSVLGHHALISATLTNAGRITFGRITIGKGVTVGASSIIMPNTEIGDGAIVAAGSIVQPGTRIPAGETWRGNPARKWQ